MRSVGLITEYNPFHNGHLHHLQESLRVTDAEVSVAVMSGHFLQRGEPALVDKWARAEMALAAGVDLVVELPLPWAASSAPDFARGAVQALEALGVDSLCFGSESGEIETLRDCANFLHDHDSVVAKAAADLLRQGMTYPQARAQTLSRLLPGENRSEILAEPNNILGIEYLKALREVESSMESFTIRRIGAGYHNVLVGSNGIASATGIRKKLAASESVDDLLPPSLLAVLNRAISGGEYFSPEQYFRQLLAQTFRWRDRLTHCWLVDNGIENRLLDVAEKSFSLADLVSGLKSRQLTRTRIQRMLISVLLEMEKNETKELLSTQPRYLHLLATSPQGQKFLASRRKHRTLPLIQNFSRVYATLKRHYGADSTDGLLAFEQLELELRATKIYTLLMHNYTQGSRNRDFYEALRTDVSY